MTIENHQDHVKYLFDLLSQQNDSTYIGEKVSQLAHSLQAAHLAAISGCKEDLAIAALLHDIGQVLPLDAKTSSKEKYTQFLDDGNMIDENGINVGRVGHEKIGEVYLRLHGWPEDICQLVGAHVIVKRYLATSSEYLSSFSKASQSSLKQQGGPFSDIEKVQFETCDPLWKEKITLRRCNDNAKVVGRQTRDLQQWWPVALRVYQSKGRSRVDLIDVEKADVDTDRSEE